jgi:uncharacterized protein (DUF1330 family)
LQRELRRSLVNYLVASKSALDHLPAGCRPVADGEMISFEQPWTFGSPLIARLPDGADLAAVKARMSAGGFNAFVVEGLEEPGSGQAYVLGGHIMRDMERFRPYAAAVPDVVRSFGGRFLARGGTVTPIAGTFIPERVVLIEFPTADDALSFYISDRYAPLLKIGLATTEARLVILARSGDLPAHIHAAAQDYLRGQS